MIDPQPRPPKKGGRDSEAQATTSTTPIAKAHRTGAQTFNNSRQASQLALNDPLAEALKQANEWPARSSGRQRWRSMSGPPKKETARSALFDDRFRLAVQCDTCGRWLTADASKRAGRGPRCATKVVAK